MSKALRGGYKNELQPHCVVQAKMRARAPGSEPRPGDRVPFVFLAAGDKAVNWRSAAAVGGVSERAEDPAWAAAHPDDCRLDYFYYLRNQLRPALIDLLAAALGSEEAAAAAFEDVGQREYANRHARQHEITRFFAREDRSKAQCLVVEEDSM